MLKNLRDGSRIARGEQAALKAALDANAGAFGTLGLGAGMRGEGAALSNGAKATTKVGSWHKVFTAVAVLAPLESAREPGYVLQTAVEETGVKFDPSGTVSAVLVYCEHADSVQYLTT